MKKLIVDASIEWVDRKDIVPGDAITCRHKDYDNCICIYATFGLPNPEWQIIQCSTGKTIAAAREFTGFFSGENTAGVPLVGWKFYKID